MSVAPSGSEGRSGRARVVGSTLALVVAARDLATALLGRSGLGQEPYLALKVIGALESLVDAGEAQVGDIVERRKTLEHGQPDLLGCGLGPRLPHGVLDRLSHGIELCLGHGPVLGG